MWCSTCQQDVPGVAHAASGRMVCSRCRRPLRNSAARPAAELNDAGIALDDPAAAALAARPPLRGDDLSARHHVRRLGRELRRPISTPPPPTDASQAPRASLRIDPPQDLFDQLEQATAPRPAPIAADPPISTRRRSPAAEQGQYLAWATVLAGSVGLAAGIGLIGWSLGAQQMAYWNVALGLSLGGQGLLIFGLVMVLTRLWRSSRTACGKLQDVQARLGQLQHTADALMGTRTRGAPAFYADLARGASPQTLLSNLKGQVDQLAARMGGG